MASGSVNPAGLAEGVSGGEEPAEACPQSAVNVHPLFGLVRAPVTAFVVRSTDLGLRWVISAPVQQERLALEPPAWYVVVCVCVRVYKYYYY